MKKLLVFAIVAFGMVTGAQAQEVNFGAKAGVNFASFSGDDADDAEFDGKTGFHLGVIAEIAFSSRFSVQPEVLYSTRGAKNSDFFFEDEFGDDMSGEIDVKLDYIEIPIMLKYYVAQGFSLQAGPQLSFNTKSEMEFSDGSDSITIGVEDETESFEFGGAVGVGYDLPVGVFFQGRYTMGFSDVYTDSDIRNNVFQLSVGYKF
ncbi:porin family protein [Salinimicrobium soli]|uniref:porin family protein n=1 Tax=Salinimicrobium soli TaxID=1254399 RepID=UPI003AAB8A32